MTFRERNPIRASTHGNALFGSIQGQGSVPFASRVIRSAIVPSARCSPARNTQGVSPKTISEQHFAIDPDKIEKERKFDGIFVLRTNTDLNPLEAMLCYKQLWTVEQTFRTAKHLFSTRPIFHKLDETIRGHVFGQHAEANSSSIGRPGSFLRAGVEEGAGGSHRSARPLRLLAGDRVRATAPSG
jgi:hypothetical protein